MTGDPNSVPRCRYQRKIRFNLREVIDYSPTADLAAAEEKNGLRAFLGDYDVVLPSGRAKDENADPLTKLRSYLTQPCGNAPSRFSDGSFSVAYMGEESETCRAEVEHHLEDRLKHSAAPKIKTHYFVLAQFALTGETLDVRRGHPALHDKNDWGPAQAFGAKAKSNDEDGITFNAERRAGSEAVAVLKAGLVQSGTRVQILGLRWDGSRVVPV